MNKSEHISASAETPSSLREEHVMPAGPGRRLRAAREAVNISRAFIAQQLHLTEQLLTAIEADDYTATPTPVFVRGYLRAYARLVEVSPDEIVRMFDQLDIPQRRQGVSSYDFHQRQVSVKDWRMIGMSISIFLALLILVAVWWKSHYALNLPQSTMKAEKTRRVEITDNMIDEGETKDYTATENFNVDDDALQVNES